MLRVAYRRDPGKTELRILALKEAIQEQIKEGDWVWAYLVGLR